MTPHLRDWLTAQMLRAETRIKAIESAFNDPRQPASFGQARDHAASNREHLQTRLEMYTTALKLLDFMEEFKK